MKTRTVYVTASLALLFAMATATTNQLSMPAEFESSLFSRDFLNRLRNDQTSPCLKIMQGLEVKSYYSSIEDGDSTTGARILYYVYFSHDLTTCENATPKEIFQSYWTRSAFEEGPLDPIDSTIDKDESFLTSNGNTVSLESTVGLGGDHKSKLTFLITIQNIEKLRIAGFLAEPTILQNMRDGSGERQHIYFQVLFGLDTPLALVRWLQLKLTIDTPLTAQGRITEGAEVQAKEILKPECDDLCTVRNDNIAIVVFCDSFWNELTQPIFFSLEPVYIKVYLKDSSSLRQLNPIRITMNSDALRRDTLVYSKPLTIGIDKISHEYVGKELRITLKLLRSGKTNGLTFQVYVELGSLGPDDEFRVENINSVPQSLGGNGGRRLLKQRALQEQPDEYLVQVIETSSQQAYEDKEQCAEENDCSVCGGTVVYGQCSIKKTGGTETNYVPYYIGGLILVIVGVVFVLQTKKHDKEVADLKRKYEVAEIKSKV